MTPKDVYKKEKKKSRAKIKKLLNPQIETRAGDNHILLKFIEAKA